MTENIEDWAHKCDRLAELGVQYEFPIVYKAVVLQCMLIGESKRLFEARKLEGLTYGKVITKLKEYARGVRLDGDANKGKQAVNMIWCQEGGEGEDGDTGEEGENGDLN